MSSVRFDVSKDLEGIYKRIQGYKWPENKADLVETVMLLHEYLKNHQLQDHELFRRSESCLTLVDYLNKNEVAETTVGNQTEISGRELFNHIYAELDTNLFLFLLPQVLRKAQEL